MISPIERLMISSKCDINPMTLPQFPWQTNPFFVVFFGLSVYKKIKSYLRRLDPGWRFQ